MQRMPMPMSMSICNPHPLQPQYQVPQQHQVPAPSSSSGGGSVPFLVGSPPSSSTASSLRGDHPGGSTNSLGLPTSVRGAPPGLRRLIRKRQNSESAKRCRQRKKIEDARAAGELATQGTRIRRLEAVVSTLCQRLEGTQTALASLCARAGICMRCAGVGCTTCANNSNTHNMHATSANGNGNGNNNNVPGVSPIANITIGSLGNGPYSPQSVQGADASALAAKVDEIAGWN